MKEDLEYTDVLEKIKRQITKAEYQIAISANATRNHLYYKIGEIIMKYRKADTGFIQSLSKDLLRAYPNAIGYSPRNLNYMKQFAEVKLPKDSLKMIIANINWRSITTLIDKIKTKEEFVWYANQCLKNGWSSTVLLHQIESDLFARQSSSTKLSNYRERLSYPLSEQAEETLKDPYVLDFLPNGGPLKERELEKELIKRIKDFLLELGSGFAFVGQQYMLKVGGREFFLDLLFYNTKLHCYFVVELKTVEFEPEFAGKLSFYLSAVDVQLKSESDNPSIGLLLCKSKNRIVAEYALKDIEKPIGVSEYRLSGYMSDEIKQSLPNLQTLEEKINR